MSRSKRKSGKSKGPSRDRDLRRDARLYWRVVSRLGAYKALALATIVTMTLEAALGLASLSMVYPVLKVIFEDRPIRAEHYAEKYALASSSEGGEVLLEGYFFLTPHLDQALREAEAAGEGSRVRPGRLFYVSGPLWARLSERLAEQGSSAEPLSSAPGTANLSPEALAGLPPAPGFVDSWKVWAIDRAEKKFEEFQETAKNGGAEWRFQALQWVVGALIAMTLLKVVAAFFAAWLGSRLGFAVIRDMRQEFYVHALALDFKYYDEGSVGDLISRATADLGALQTVVTMLFSRVMHAPIKTVFYLSGMLWISPELTAAALVALAPICGVLLYFSNRVRRASRRIQQRRGDLSSILQETFAGARTVKAYCMEEAEAKRFGGVNERLFRQQNRACAFEEISSQANEVILVTVVGGLILVGGYFVLSQKAIDGSAFVTFLALLGSMWGPIRAFGKSFVKTQQGLAGAERVFEVMDARPAVADAPDAAEYDGEDSSVEFRGVSFAYNEAGPVLKNIDLKVPAGKLVALAGRTGSGKTTLASLVPRFYDATEGAALVGGRDARDWTLKSLRGNIAYVSQHAVLFDDTVRANIAYGRSDATDQEIEDAARAANIHDEIMALPKGYGTIVGGQGAKLSGGQRQRVAVARALLKNAPILILDEATSALDVETEKLVQRALDRLMEGRTSIVIAHRLSTIRQADEICFLKDGQIAERGSLEELMALDGEYARFERLQASDMSPGGLG